MKNKQLIWNYVLVFTITVILGTISHFLFEWIHFYGFAPFVPVNESIFEHLKLLFYPFMFVSVIELLIRKKRLEKLMPARIFSIMLSIVLMLFLYSFLKWLGFVNLIVDIFRYVAYLFLAYYLSYIAEVKHFMDRKAFRIAALILAVIVVFIFSLTTFCTPKWEIFRDPSTGGYGIL